MRETFLEDIVQKWVKASGTTKNIRIPKAVTPASFREQVVWPLCEERPQEPLVLLIDECEILGKRQPILLEELLYTISECEPNRLQAILSSGRQLGEPISQALKGLLKNSKTVRVEPFNREAITLLLDAASPLTFDSDATDAMYQETGGHPLLFCALADHLFDRRKRRDSPGPVPQTEIRKAARADEVLREVESHMDWVWDQVTRFQDQLTRIVCDLTYHAAAGQFRRLGKL